MLVLARRKHEEIYLNAGRPDQITVAVLDLAGGKVRLGIDAPADCSIFRREVWEAIQREELHKQELKGEA